MRISRGRTAASIVALLGALLVAASSAAAAPGAIVNVPSQIPTIQAAIDAVADGGSVVVAPGVYRENIDFHGRRVEVRSADGPDATVIDGGGDGPVVIFARSETRATTLRGFTIRNGSYSGIFIANAGPTVVGNVVTGNTSSAYGGGFSISTSTGLIKGNIVKANTASIGGGFQLQGVSGLEIVGNTIEHNRATSGGGMNLFHAEGPLISNNVFRANHATLRAGGGMEIQGSSWPMISQNVFAENESVGGAGALSISSPVGVQGTTLANNTLVGNLAVEGSAISANGDWLAVNNVISGPPTVALIRCEGTFYGRFFYNDVFNGTESRFKNCPDTTGIVGNISAEPRLRPDYGLQAGSPAIDAGHDDPLQPLLQPTDANGNVRLYDGDGDGVAQPDLGAFEWPGVGVPPSKPAAGAYHPLTPARILDTRTGLGGGPGKVGPGSTLSLQVTGRGEVPAAGVSAVALNVTVTEPTAGSFLTAWPAGETRPLASNLNYDAGKTVPNMVMVKVGAGGKVNLFNNSGSVHVIADVAGWYGDYGASLGTVFTPLEPSRLLDTRDGTGRPAGRLAGGATAFLQVTGRGGVPGLGVSAVALNVTVTEPDGVGFLAAYPTGVSLPLVSNLNYGRGDTVANVVVATMSVDGVVNLYVSTSAHVIVDVAGWYGEHTPTPVGAYTALPPARILDTRTGNGAPAGRLGPGATLTLQVTGRGGVPTVAVGAVVLNVTVTEPTGVSFLTAWPGGAARPLASNLNYVAGQTVPNLVVVQVGAGGTVNLFNYAGSTHVVADVAGWYGS